MKNFIFILFTFCIQIFAMDQSVSSYKQFQIQNIPVDTEQQEQTKEANIAECINCKICAARFERVFFPIPGEEIINHITDEHIKNNICLVCNFYCRFPTIHAQGHYLGMIQNEDYKFINPFQEEDYQFTTPSIDFQLYNSK